MDDINQKTTKTKDSKLKRITSDLKYFKQLEPQSKVLPIDPRIGPKDKRRNFLNDDKKFAKLWPQKQLQYLRAKRESEEKNRIKSDPKLRFKVYDIWDDKQETDQIDSDVKELIDYQQILKGSKPPKVPKHRYTKPSLLPSVEVPLSGQSYNPTLEDHANLLAMAHNIEVQKIRKEEHLNRVVDGFYVTKANAPNDKMWAQEMSHGLGLSEDEDESQNSENPDDNEGSAIPQLIRADNKKTRSQRRKQLLQKQLEAKKKLEKSLKSKENSIFKLKSYKKEIKNKEKESLERLKRRSQRLIEKQYKPKRMSRYNYEEPDVELKLSGELVGSLRTLKTEGNLLEDRFKSIQRRNIIESRTKQTFKRKFKLKKIPKKSCKEPIV